MFKLKLAWIISMQKRSHNLIKSSNLTFFNECNKKNLMDEAQINNI